MLFTDTFEDFLRSLISISKNGGSHEIIILVKDQKRRYSIFRID